MASRVRRWGKGKVGGLVMNRVRTGHGSKHESGRVDRRESPRLIWRLEWELGPCDVRRWGVV
eukprot:4242398-Pleurochrysis_carterae.AAC.1